MSGTLYLLPTVIADNTLELTIPQGVVARAHTIRRFYVEAAKTARAYLKALQHPEPIASLTIEEIGHDPDPLKIDAWLAPVLDGEDAAIVSESGCPGIADPGAQLVARAHELGIRVVPLAGPSSLLMTLMASGLDGQRFRFSGYLPIHEAERKAAVLALEAASRASETQLFIETPYRNQALFESLLSWLRAETRLCVAADITGTGERIVTRTVCQWRALAAQEPALAKVPTVFALLAPHKGPAPRYAPQDATHKGAPRSRERGREAANRGQSHKKSSHSARLHNQSSRGTK
mgnify:CR=1 FL=1